MLTVKLSCCTGVSHIGSLYNFDWVQQSETQAFSSVTNCCLPLVIEWGYCCKNIRNIVRRMVYRKPNIQFLKRTINCIQNVKRHRLRVF